MSAAAWIDAAPAAVWEVLADLRRYPEWNPLFPSAAGDLAAGRRLTLQRADDDGRRRTIRARVTTVIPAAELGWVFRPPGMTPGLIIMCNCTLRAGNGGTLVLQREAVHGFLARYYDRRLDRDEDGFRALNGALKARVENQ
ncbi:MAG: SRPBCC domain-containing protein [Actinobacteria bacterium]|nr:SRPBCC domain-containing protein [Actinomycetota bacterium]